MPRAFRLLVAVGSMAEAEKAEWDVYDKVIRTVPQRPAAAAPATPPPVAGWQTAPFGLELAADRPVYRVTDPVTLTVKAEADCHLSPLNMGPGGASRLLFPNRYQQQTLIRTGQTMVVPDRGHGLDRTAGAGVGEACDGALPERRGAVGRRAVRLPGRVRFATFDDVSATARNLAVFAALQGSRRRAPR